MTQPVVNALIKVESNGNTQAISSAGAKGAAQVMPATAKDPGFGVKPLANDSMEEHQRFAKDYLTQLHKKYGDLTKALQAYNWGTGNMDAYLKTGKGMNGQEMPQETKDYPGKVFAKMGTKPSEPIQKIDIQPIYVKAKIKEAIKHPESIQKFVSEFLPKQNFKQNLKKVIDYINKENKSPVNRFTESDLIENVKIYVGEDKLIEILKKINS